MRLRPALAGLAVWPLAAAPAADQAPRWLATAAQQPTPAYAAGAPALVLWHEAEVTVDPTGKITTTEHYAVRVLKPEGRKAAVSVKYYTPDTDKVNELRAWLIGPSGQARALGKDYAADQEVPSESLYEQMRERSITGSRECGEGMVFGYESVVEERSVFTQLEWQFQERLPAMASRYTLHTPAGWEMKTVLLNHAPMEPAAAGNTSTWELRDLAYLEAEADSPPITVLAPRLAISLFPAAGTRTTLGQTFANWLDVSRYTAELQDPQSMPDAAIVSRAQLLTAGAPSEIDKIRAIAGYVQNLRYVSIQMGLGRGGGYRPHPASWVFAKGYGDCKDKANLMRAMLRALGISSYPVLIYANDARYVREEWPSPRQFNHCILAIMVSEAVSGYAVVQVPSAGRLLIFDSTDPHTPLGAVPEDEQNSLALIAAGDRGALIRVPEAPAENNRVERTTEMELGVDGSLRGSVTERFFGSMAVRARSQYRENGNGEVAKTLERWMAGHVPGTSISLAEPSDNFPDNTFRLALQFAAPHYGQLMQNRLLVFRPGAVPRSDFVPVTTAERKYPLVVKGEIFRETVKAKLPPGFAVDEIPAGARVEGSLGIFKSTCLVKDNEITWIRSLDIQAQVIPAARYGEVKSFLQRVADAEAEPIVLVRK
ncbi:MAG TPA: DUF3857 domain-containing protein [Bryobacteraceae bacterium]|nr:DUF3857 domain-containing protein [Bryobacteraceae bacterium]